MRIDTPREADDYRHDAILHDAILHDAILHDVLCGLALAAGSL